jgi:ataxia telangiectasia mutated family protein
MNELTQQKRKIQVLYEQDTSQFLEVTTARDTYLEHAITMLSHCLEASDEHDDDAPYRICSLWFSNFTNDALGPIISPAVARVASRKFVFLAHQLSARLSLSPSKSTQSQETLQTLLLRMCSEHPFHSLYQVYSLRPSQRKESSRRHSSRHDVESNSQAERTAAAVQIFERLREMPERGKIVQNIEHLCDAYLEWAKYPIRNDAALAEKRRKKEQMHIPSHLLISKIQDVSVPVVTALTALDPSLQYKDCVWVKGYRKNFDTAGGINLPKISYCEGSDGRIYKQLVSAQFTVDKLASNQQVSSKAKGMMICDKTP